MRFSVLFAAADADALADHDDRYGLLLDVVKLVDDSAVSAVWIAERHFHRHGGLYPNPAVVAAAVATQTTRLGIRATDVLIPPGNPCRVAEDWSVVDQLSGGRIALGFDAERNSPTAIEQLRRVWRGDHAPASGSPQSDGPFWPRPVQRELPVWLAAHTPEHLDLARAAGFPVLIDLAAHTRDAITPDWSAYQSEVEHWLSSPSGTETAVVLPAFVHADEEAARRISAAPLRGYYAQRGRWAEATAALAGPDLIGDERTVAATALRLADRGVDEIVCLIDFGLGAEDTQRSVLHLCEVAEKLTTPRVSALPE